MPQSAYKIAPSVQKGQANGSTTKKPIKADGQKFQTYCHEIKMEKLLLVGSASRELLDGPLKVTSSLANEGLMIKGV